MSTFEQPGKMGTEVTDFKLEKNTLVITLDRADSKRYRTDTKPPSAADIPADYLAALNSWIAKLR